MSEDPRIARIRRDIAELKRGRVTHREVQVTAADPVTSTFSADLPDGQPLTGIAAPREFLPAPGQPVTLRLEGATPIYDPAGISSLSPTKIENGTFAGDFTVAGRFTTALTGQRSEMNAVGFQAWDSDNNLTISLDGVNNVLTGKFQTAMTGRRIEMGAAGAQGKMSFFAPDGAEGFVRSLTESTGIEAIQFGLEAGANSLWNRINYNSDLYASYRTRTHEFVYTSAFQVRDGDDGTGLNGTIKLQVYKAGMWSEYMSTGTFAVYERNASNNIQAGRLIMGASGATTFYRSPGGDFGVWERLVGGVDVEPRFRVTDTHYWFEWPNVDSRFLIQPSTAAGISPLLQFVGPENFGGTMFYRSNTDGSSGRFEFRNVTATAGSYQALWASAFTPSSSGINKENVTDYTGDAMAEVRAIKPVTFRRKPGKNSTGKDAPESRVEFGVIAEEVPEVIRVRDETGEVYGVDLQSEVTLAFAALKQLDARLSKLETTGKAPKP